MTWIDIVLIIFIFVALGVGARLGSLWTVACLAGGFFGAFLVDMYAFSFSGLLGRFPAATSIASVVLFSAGCAAILLPGWLFSRISAGLFLGIVDSAIGLLAGGLAGLCTITLCLLVLVPLFPKVEKTRAWKNSFLVKPFHRLLEETFSTPHFRAPSSLTPAAREAGSELKDAASRILHEIKQN